MAQKKAHLVQMYKLWVKYTFNCAGREFRISVSAPSLVAICPQKNLSGQKATKKCQKVPKFGQPRHFQSQVEPQGVSRAHNWPRNQFQHPWKYIKHQSWSLICTHSWIGSWTFHPHRITPSKITPAISPPGQLTPNKLTPRTRTSTYVELPNLYIHYTLS